VRRLFLRIFLWFWAAFAVVAATLVLTSPYFTASRPGVERWQRAAEEGLEARVEELALSVGRGELGPPRRPMWDGGPRRTAVHVLDAGGEAVLGPPPSRGVSSFARRVAGDGEVRSERRGAVHLVGRAVTAPDGRRLVVVAAALRRPRLVDLIEPGELAWRLGLLVLLVGGLCFWLARTLTAPVGGLQEAVRRLAAGDLEARAGSAVVRRRDEIGDLARDFNAMAARLAALIAAQQRLLRDVSHELRSPLTRLFVAIGLARQQHEPAPELARIELEAGRRPTSAGAAAPARRDRRAGRAPRRAPRAPPRRLAAGARRRAGRR